MQLINSFVTGVRHHVAVSPGKSVGWFLWSPIFRIPRAVPGSWLPLMGHGFRVPDVGPTVARGRCGAISSFHVNRIGEAFLLAVGLSTGLSFYGV